MMRNGFRHHPQYLESPSDPKTGGHYPIILGWNHGTILGSWRLYANLDFATIHITCRLSQPRAPRTVGSGATSRKAKPSTRKSVEGRGPGRSKGRSSPLLLRITRFSDRAEAPGLLECYKDFVLFLWKHVWLGLEPRGLLETRGFALTGTFGPQQDRP